jgi:5-hydroxyisourate hydrolase
MSTISSHVLDTALGRPAAGLTVTLDVLGEGGGWMRLAAASTDADGRVRRLSPETALAAGTYRVTFDTGVYFAAAGRPVFYPRVDVVFVVAGGGEHYHIPLIMSPFGYSTYRGS